MPVLMTARECTRHSSTSHRRLKSSKRIFLSVSSFVHHLRRHTALECVAPYDFGLVSSRDATDVLSCFFFRTFQNGPKSDPDLLHVARCMLHVACCISQTGLMNDPTDPTAPVQLLSNDAKDVRKAAVTYT